MIISYAAASPVNHGRHLAKPTYVKQRSAFFCRPILCPRNYFNVGKADLEKPHICEFADPDCFVNIGPVSAIVAGLIILDLSAYTSTLVIYWSFPS